jgi:hypothetical protein
MSIVLNIVSDFDTRGIKKAEKAFSEIQNAGSKVGASLKKAFLPAAVALGGLAVAGANFAMAAAEDQQSAALLARQLKTTTKATDAQVKATEDFILQMSLANGVADDELRPSLAKLTRGTKDIAKAQKLLALSMDISKGSGKSLAQVTDSISKALGGNMTALSRLSPEVKQMVKDNKSLDEITAALGKTYAGAATTSADTFKGRMDRLKIAISETKESIGYALLPIFERMVSFITSKILPVVQRFVDSIGEKGLGQTLKNSAGDLGNWLKSADGATGAAIDFGAAIVVLATAFKGLAFLTGVAATLTAVNTALAGLAGIVPALAGAGLATIAAAIGLIVINLAALFSLLRDDSDRTYIVKAIQDFCSLIANAFIGMYKSVRTVMNLLAGAGNFVTSAFGLGDQFGKLPDVGFMGMSRASDFASARPSTITNPGANQAGVPGAPIININTGVGDPVAIGKSVVDALQAYQNRSGPLPLKVG